jgi:DNA-binding phage protein
MAKSVSYHSYLMQALKDPTRAEGYLEAAIDENDLELLQDVVNDVIEAIGDHPDLVALQKAKQVLNATSNIY